VSISPISTSKRKREKREKSSNERRGKGERKEEITTYILFTLTKGGNKM